MINFVKQIIRDAGQILLTTSRQVTGKKGGSGNWVTEADLASEHYLIKNIRRKFADHAILAEETQARIRQPEQEPNLWIIDPLDGTTNYSFGIPFYCVSVAYAQKGEVKAAAIYDPVRDELFWSEVGSGAYLNTTTIKVDQRKNFSGGLVGIGFPYQKENLDRTYPLGNVFHEQGARLVILGSAALACAYVAAGRLSLYYEWGLKPWDLAAAKLMVEEAGGVMQAATKPFSFFAPREVLVGPSSLVDLASERQRKRYHPHFS